MSSIINTNLASLGAQAQLDKSRGVQSQAIQRLSSGLRINSAADDAAGLAIAARMSTQIRGLNVAARNAQDAISLSQTAEGSLASISDNLQRMRELAVQSANSSNSTSDRQALQAEVAQLASEIDRVAVQANFNGQNLLDGSFTSSQFQIGAGSGSDQKINLAAIASARANVLGATGGAPVTGPVATTTATGSGLSAASVIDGAGQLLINGVDVYQGSTIAADASLIVGAINTAAISGVTATAAPNSLAGTYSPSAFGTSVSFQIYGSGVTSTTAFDRASTITVVQSAFQYGLAPVYPHLSAADNGNGLTITTNDGSNIVLGSDQDISLIGLGGLSEGSVASPTTYYSTYSLSYTGTAGLSIGGSKAALLGLTPVTVPTPPIVGGTAAIGQIDVSTAVGANSALASLDVAIDSVSAVRAGLGAAQNRFAAAISNIYTAVASASAARSRITDADFAAETAKLASSNVLQQAASALVAQANALPSNVLILLRN